MLYGHLYQLRWGDNVKVESRYSLSLFNALKYSWTLCHNPKVVSAWDLLSFRFLLEKSTWRTFLYAAGQKDANHVQKESSLGRWGGGECLSLSLSAIPHAICHHQSRCSQQNSKKAAPKMQYACEKWTYKRSKYSAHAHRDTIHTHICTSMFEKCATENRRIFNIEFFSSFYASHLFCFVLAPRLRTRGQYEIEIAFGIWSADRQRIKIYLSSNSEPQIISVRCTRHFHFDCKRAQLIEFLGFISYVNDAPRKCGERPHSAVCVCD